MNLWCVTISIPLGRRVCNHRYAVLAASAPEAKAKAVAYVFPNPVENPEYTIEAEVDVDGVISGSTYYTKAVQS